MPAAFDEQRAWSLNPSVSLRPEPFGALAYDFGTRRLSFLKHPMLVRVVETLDQHDTAGQACAVAGVGPAQHTAITQALGTLASTGMIVERTA